MNMYSIWSNSSKLHLLKDVVVKGNAINGFIHDKKANFALALTFYILHSLSMMAPDRRARGPLVNIRCFFSTMMQNEISLCCLIR